MVGQVAVVASASIDNVLAGHLGPRVLGAVSVGSGLWVFAAMTVIGVTMATSPIVAALDGAGTRAEVPGVFRSARVVGVLVGVAAGLALGLAGPALLDAIGVAPAIRPGAASFLRIVAFGMPGLGLFGAARGLSEGLSRTHPTMVIQLGGLVVLAPLGYALMYGAAGLPALGVVGSAIATALVTIAEGVAYQLFVRFSRSLGIDWRAPAGRVRAAVAMRILRLGGPIAVSLLMEVGMFTATGLLVARLGAVPASASQIALNIVSLLFMAPLGIGLAATIRVGRATGAGDRRGVRQAVGAAATLAALLAAVDIGVLLLCGHAIAALYTDDRPVTDLASTLLLIGAAMHAPDSAQVVAGGVLRGLRDTRVPMMLTAVSYWVVGVPLVAWLVLGAGYGAAGAWIGMTAGVALAALLLGWRAGQSVRTT